MKFNKTLLIALLLIIGLFNAGRAQAFTFYQFNFIKLLPGLNLNLSMIPSGILNKMSFGYNLTSSRWCQDRTAECKKELNLSNNRCDTTYSLCVSMQQGTEAGCQYVKEKCLVNSQKVYDECIKRYVSNENRCWLTLPAKTCDTSDTKACNTATGASGTQTADYCDTVIGEWVWGDCIATPPPPPLPPLLPIELAPPVCLSSTETRYLPCPSGQTGGITQQRTLSCPDLIWSAWTTVSDTCAIPQPGACTSFNYSAWSTCTNGTQIRSITASYPAGCTGGNPVLSQSCTLSCQGTAPSCGLGYAGSYVCQNGAWVNQCQIACSQPPPACPKGWTGSYSCAPTSGGFVWANTCVPSGTPGCVKGVAYIQNGDGIWAKCVGNGYMVKGINCLMNDCGPYQPYSKWSSMDGLSTYIDDILLRGYKTYTDSSSCTATDHVYGQVRVDGVICRS